MPPRKPATDKASADEAPTLILNYLTQQNRPYSATDISSNLHNKVTKTKTDKILKELAEEGKIVGKNAGKAWIFHALQNPDDSASPEDLKALDEAINATRESLQSLKAAVKSKQNTLANIRAAPTTDLLRAEVKCLESANKEMEERLKVLRRGGIKPVSAEDKENVEMAFVEWTRKRNVRKRIFTDLEGMILDSGVAKQELWEKCGIEDDPPAI